MDAEVASQLASLGEQRRHVLGILEGLGDGELRRPMAPSGWSCLGLVQHLTYDVEHYWARCVVAGESLDFFEAHGFADHGAWRVDDGEPAEAVFQRYRDEGERADEIYAATPFDQAPAQSDPWWGSWQVPDVRFIVAHVIAETACHAGHLDVVRELLDGRRWVVL